MSETALQLKEQVLRLGEEDRLEIARILWDSIGMPDEEPQDDDAAWIAELNRRLADLKSGQATADPVDKVFDELREEAMRETTAR